MIKKKVSQMLAKALVATLLISGISGIMPNQSYPNFFQGKTVYAAAEIGTVKVTVGSLWTYSRADWNARVATVSRGNSFSAVERITVAGRDMFKLSNGRYITANTKYIHFSGSTSTPIPVPTPPPAQTTQVRTTANLNLRSGSSTSSGILAVIPKGTIVTTSGQASNGWYQVTYGGKTGYVSNKYVVVSGNTPAPTPPKPTPAPTEKYVKTTYNLNMRSGSSTSYGILNTIPQGTTVPVNGQASNGWYQVTYGGKTGYVSNKYVTTVSNYNEKTIKVPYISQYSPVYAPMGCEGATLLMAMQYKGYTNVGLKTFLDQMPKTARNPFLGFSSTPYDVITGNPPIFQSIFPEALVKYGKTYHSNVFDISGYSTDQLKEEVNKGNPVTVYVTTRNFETPKWKVYDMGEAGMIKIVENMHIMLLTGYNSNGEYQVTDPANNNKVYWVSKAKFETAYNALKWAVVAR